MFDLEPDYAGIRTGIGPRLGSRRSNFLNAYASPEGGDVTGNLLDMQCSLMHELRRRLRTVDGASVSYEMAGDVLYRVEQMHAYVEATAKALQALNLRLLGFGVETFDADEAKAIVGELGVFLDRFGRRFGPLREEIAADLAELSKPTQERRWAACVERCADSSRRRTIAPAAEEGNLIFQDLELACASEKAVDRPGQGESTLTLP